MQYPTIIDSIKNITIKKYCSGLKHSLLLDYDLNLFSFGLNDVKFNFKKEISIGGQQK
jgi:hypothetical protein